MPFQSSFRSSVRTWGVLLPLMATTLLSACGSEPATDGQPMTGGAPSTGGRMPGTGGLTTTGGESSTGGTILTGGTSTGGGGIGAGGTSGGSGSGGSGGAGGGISGGAGGGDPAGGSGGSAGSGASGGTTGGSGGEGGVVSNCTATLASGETNRSVQIDGMERTFIMQVPAGYTGSDAVPLLIDWHPLGGTGAQEKGLSGFEALSEKEGFIVLWPNGIDNAWNVGPCCTNSRDIDDVAFARAMVADLEEIACVDPKRIYAAGFSMGGGMSHYLACHAADIFAAVAPSSFDLLEENVDGCLPSRPVSVFAMRGTNDTVVPFNGGPGSSGKATFLGAQKTLEKWAELDDCVGEPETSGDTQMYKTCAAGVEVGLMTIQGGGHAAGPADVAWDFLSSKTLP